MRRKKRRLNLLKWLAKKKYIYIAYYKNEKECINRYRQNDLRVTLVDYLFSFNLSKIDFKNFEPVLNICGIKFSDKEEETFCDIENPVKNNIYVPYTNYDAYTERKGCINQKIKGSILTLDKNITSYIRTSSTEELRNITDDIINGTKKIKKYVILAKSYDFEIETVNYSEFQIGKRYTLIDLYGKEYIVKQKKNRNIEIKKLKSVLRPVKLDFKKTVEGNAILKEIGKYPTQN